MAIIQLTWVDASTNENVFNVYRSADGADIDLTNSATYDLVATLTYNASASGDDWATSKWEKTAGGGTGTPDASDNFQLTSGMDNLSTASGSTFVATYTDDDEPTTGYKWAVTAENAIGESTPTSTSNYLDIN